MKPVHLLKLIGIGLFLLVLWRIDLAEIIAIYQRVDIVTLLLVFGLFYPVMWIKSVRWRVLIPRSGTLLPGWVLFHAYVGSYFAGTVTLGRLGEFSRIGYLRRLNIPLGEASFSLLADRLLDFLALSSLSLMGTVALHSVDAPPIAFAVAALLGCALLPVLILRHESIRTRILEQMPGKRGDSIRNAIRTFGEGAEHLGYRGLLAALGWTGASWALCCLQVVALAAALSISADIVQLIGAYALAAIASLLPISVAGIGTRDAVLVVTFGLAGISSESAVAFSTSILLIYLVQGCLSLPFWIRQPSAEPVASPIAVQAYR